MTFKNIEEEADNVTLSAIHVPVNRRNANIYLVGQVLGLDFDKQVAVF